MNNNHINLNFKYDLLYVKKQFLKCVTKNLQESDCSFFFFFSFIEKKDCSIPREFSGTREKMTYSAGSYCIRNPSGK